MAKNPISEAEKNLISLKTKTEYKIWQYVILKEFIDLFSKNEKVLGFIMANYSTSFYGIIDDSVLFSKEELLSYEQNQKKTIECELLKLLDMVNEGKK